jgi:hypothetical protein
MCSTDAACGGGLCILALNDGTGGVVPGVQLCTHPCNAATQTGCPSGAECLIFREVTGAMRAFTDCVAPIGSGAEDAPCSVDTDCGAGRMCVDTGIGTSQCHHLCNATTGAGCTGGRTCVAFPTPVVTNGITYGVCTF